ncbi:hypothetical protein [Flavobacterium selenitireducens]|uniref:hypothetical protein n=1 Tax=Flavobacterium selenitireducens TaxID=2722704 RepID=UPI00168BDAF3|nr:hypothetical protein [Flavobacterium selenitireducens]MBD3583408.1 hypothetical protein [Flavobacterium selenitireducens]
MTKYFLSFLLLFGLFCYPQLANESNLVADNGANTSSRTTKAGSGSALDAKHLSEALLLERFSGASAEHKIAIAEELVERKSAKVTELFGKLLTDDSVVERKMGSISYPTNPASELYAAVAHQKEKAERKKYYERTTTKGLQKELKGMFGRDYDTKWTIAETDACLSKLTAMALADNNVSPRTLSSIFYTNGFKSKNYARVKHFATRYPTAEILATLANFKNPSDISYLTKHAQASYLAYAHYPHAAFFPTLQMNVDNDYENKDFQNAITAYKNSDSRVLLEKICANICKNNVVKMNRDDKLFQLYSIVEKSNCRLYDPVLKKIDKLMM